MSSSHTQITIKASYNGELRRVKVDRATTSTIIALRDQLRGLFSKQGCGLHPQLTYEDECWYDHKRQTKARAGSVQLSCLDTQLPDSPQGFK